MNTPLMSEHERRILIEELGKHTRVAFANGKMHVVLASDAPATTATTAGKRTFQQVCWALEHDRWEDLVTNSCDQPRCTSHLKIDTTTTAPTDDELMKLVERNSVSLADLYRKGRARGLISARSGY